MLAVCKLPTPKGLRQAKELSWPSGENAYVPPQATKTCNVRRHLAVQFREYFYYQNSRKSNEVKNIVFTLINFTSELRALPPMWHAFDYGLRYML